MAATQAEPRQIEPELLQRLGLIVVHWALVEHEISVLFTKMAEADIGPMSIVTSTVSQSTIIGWIRTLLDTSKTSPDNFNELREVLNEIDELRAERNALVHGLWLTHGPANSVIVQTVNPNRSEIIKGEVVTAADLSDLISRIVEVANHLHKIVTSVTISR